FVVAHEFGHYVWGDLVGYDGPDLEARCDALAASIVAPRRAFARAVACHGLDTVSGLAAALQTTRSTTLLRIGEAVDLPAALLRRRRSTIVRGPHAVWPVPLSWQPVKRARGIVRVRITDEPGRLGARLG